MFGIRLKAILQTLLLRLLLIIGITALLAGFVILKVLDDPLTLIFGALTTGFALWTLHPSSVEPKPSEPPKVYGEGKISYKVRPWFFSQEGEDYRARFDTEEFFRNRTK